MTPEKFKELKEHTVSPEIVYDSLEILDSADGCMSVFAFANSNKEKF